MTAALPMCDYCEEAPGLIPHGRGLLCCECAELTQMLKLVAAIGPDDEGLRGNIHHG